MNFSSGSYTFVSETIGGIEYPLAKYVWGAVGVSNQVTEATPLPVQVTTGELLDAIRALQLAVHSLTRSIGLSMPDSAGRQRVVTDAASALGTVATVTTVTGVTAVATLTNQTQIGAVAANPQVPALMQLAADNLRSRIITS